MSFLRPPRKISFTREGLIFTGLTLPIGMAAVNTGNNMLYLILGLMLSIIALNGIFSESTVKEIEVTLKLPQRVYVHQPFISFVEIENQKRFAPSFLMRLSHLWETIPFKKDRKSRKSPPFLTKQAFCIKILPGEKAKLRVESTFLRRGKYAFKGLRIATRFPFGLFDKSRDVDLPAEVIVYPEKKVFPIPGADRSAGLGQYESSQKGLGGDLYALRPYTIDDDARHIHWRISAKVGSPMVREFEATGQEKVFVFFDHSFHKAKNLVSDKELQFFENALSAISFLLDEAHEKGQWIGFATSEKTFSPERGEQHFTEIMDYLAEIQPAYEAPTKPFEMFGRGHEVIQLSPQDFVHV